MKGIKDFSFILIPYLIICSGLYHIAYWDTFDINGLAYIGVSDLIKSFVYPFLTFGTAFFLAFVLSEIVFRTEDWFPSNSQDTSENKKALFPSGGGRYTKVGRALNSRSGIFTLVVLWAILVVFLYDHGDELRWIMWGAVVSLVPYFTLDRVGFLNSVFSNNSVRQFVIRILIYIPAFAFASGKYESELNYRNIQYKYIISSTAYLDNIPFTSDTIKIIGTSDKYFFMTDLSNSRILLLRSDKVDALTIYQY